MGVLIFLTIIVLAAGYIWLRGSLPEIDGEVLDDASIASTLALSRAACTTDADCSLNGVCTGGSCLCDDGWTTYDDLKDRVKAYMKRQNEQEARQSFMASLRKDAKVKIVQDHERCLWSPTSLAAIANVGEVQVEVLENYPKSSQDLNAVETVWREIRARLAETEMNDALMAFNVIAPGRVDDAAGPGGPGIPVYRPAGYKFFDSLGVEECGNICVATIGECGISVISPQGELVEFVATPDIFTTNICWGGADRRDAYITLSGTGKLAKMRWPRPGLKLVY